MQKTFNIKSIEEKKIGVFLGVESLKFLRDASEIQELYERGLRHVSLTWNEPNKFAAGAYCGVKGLTEEGMELIREIEKLGMVIDLSHTNYMTFEEIIDIVHKPVIVSHGNCKGIYNHVRNYTDKQLLQIKETGGVIGISAKPHLLTYDRKARTVKKIAEHIDYAVKLMGIDHVGMGLDITYYIHRTETKNRVKGMEHIGKVSKVFTELKKMGYSTEDIDKIKYKNFERVIKTVL